MPKLVKLSNFAKAGINSDLLPWDLPGDFLTEVKNIRIANEKLSPAGGFSPYAILPVDFEPGYIINIDSSLGSFWVIPGLDAVYAYDGNAFGDISSVGGYPGISLPELWHGDQLSSLLILNNPSHHPEYWPSTSIAVPLLPLPWDETQTWDEAGESCKIMRAHKQYLFAMDLVSQGEEIPDGVRWSSPAPINGVPVTWNELDLTNVAGLTNLGGSGGSIVDGRPLRDAFCIYRDKGVTVFDYVGGAFVWQVRNLTDEFGLVSRDALVDVKGTHYFIGDGDIYTNDGNTIKSLLHKRLRVRFLADFDADNFTNSFAIKNYTVSEVWFCVPRPGAKFPNVAYIYNWRDDTWSIRDIPETPFANYGTQGSPAISWDDVGLPWDSLKGSWGQRQLSPLDDTIVAVLQAEEGEPSGKLVLLDVAISTNTSDFESVIERIGYALDGLDQVTTMTRIYPHIAGPGAVYITVGSQDFPGSPIRWKPEVLFDSTISRKLDVRTTGELHCFRFRSTNSDLYWELSGIDIEYVPAGVR
jgi:hypothetical protein